MIQRLLLVVVVLGAAATPAAAENSSVEGSFKKIVDWTYESDGVRISNCHIVASSFGSFEARAKCYAMNKSNQQMRVRIRFTALDKKGDAVVDATLTPLGILQSGDGQELAQSIPITQQEWESITTGRLKATILPPS